MDNTILLFREYVRLDKKRSGRGLSVAEFRRWSMLKRKLDRKFQPGASNRKLERRASVRVPTHLAVSFTSVGELRQCWMTNLSRGGLFIVTDELAEIGTRLKVRIGIAETEEELEVPAEVVSHNVGPKFESKSGMGMRFLDMAEDVRKKLDDIYESALLKAADESE